MVLPDSNRASGGGKTRSTGQGPYPSIGGKGVSRPMHGGKGKGRGHRRHRKILKDTIQGITKGDIRRMARRGGVKRISAAVYEESRSALRDRLSAILKDCCIFLDHDDRKTITVSDVIFALKRLGNPIYGFDKSTYLERKRSGRHAMSR